MSPLTSIPPESPLGARDERGFTILEALIAAALATLVAFTGLAVCKTLGRVTLQSIGSQRGTEATEALTAQLRTDAASALAVFVPGSDMYGRPNRGQEVDFFSKTDDGAPILWRYVYDSAAQTLTRSDYDSSGASGVRDVRSGSIDTAASYPALKDVERFEATAIGADRLGDAAGNTYGGIGALFEHTPAALPVHYAAAGFNLSDIEGGNGVVQVSLASATATRLVHLAAGSMPTGFTVTGAPVWHAVVYRLDQTHRSFFGLVGKSHVFINARIDVSYDGWQSSKTWCDFNLLGNPHGLDGHDPHADYKPNEAIEQSTNILAACRRQNPQPPARDSAGFAPDPGAIHPPLPVDTPPPCWSRPGPTGRCWPVDAPPDWAPPEPLPPGETPPASWCATHAASPLCASQTREPRQAR